METVIDFIFWGSKITADGDSAMKLKDAYSLEGKLWPNQTDSISKSRDITFPTKVSSQGCGFSTGHVWM